MLLRKRFEFAWNNTLAGPEVTENGLKSVIRIIIVFKAAFHSFLRPLSHIRQLICATRYKLRRVRNRELKYGN